MTEIRVLVGTTDFERSSAFYGGMLGFDVAEHWDDVDGRGTLFRVASGGVVEIFEDSAEHPFVPPAGVRVAIEVDDADSLYARVAHADADIVDPIREQPWGQRSFEIRDPSGLSLVFFTALNKALSPVV